MLGLAHSRALVIDGSVVEQVIGEMDMGELYADFMAPSCARDLLGTLNMSDTMVLRVILLAVDCTRPPLRIGHVWAQLVGILTLVHMLPDDVVTDIDCEFVLDSLVDFGLTTDIAQGITLHRDRCTAVCNFASRCIVNPATVYRLADVEASAINGLLAAASPALLTSAISCRFHRAYTRLALHGFRYRVVADTLGSSTTDMLSLSERRFLRRASAHGMLPAPANGHLSWYCRHCFSPVHACPMLRQCSS